MAELSPDVHHIGLESFRITCGPMARPHLHPELEFNILLAGDAAYETPHGLVALPRRRLVAFWGGYPHRLTGHGDLDLIAVTLPLDGLAGHPVLTGPTHRLLAGGIMTGSRREGAADVMLVARWADELRSRPARPMADLCLLEMQARLARLGATGGASTAPAAPPAGAAVRLLTVIAGRYADHVTAGTLAREAGVHPTYAAKIFTQTFGMSMWRYVEQLRVAYAQRLLRGTTWSVDRIGHESGYGSRSAFYRAFHAVSGRSPSAYRGSGAGPAAA